MKRILLIIIALFITANIAQAQTFEFFKPSEGLERARTQAVEVGGFADPKLVFIGTINQTFDLGVAGMLSIELKMEDGTSNGWVYIFRAGDNQESLVAYILIKSSLLGYLPFPIPISQLLEGGIPIEPKYTLDDVQWIKSDVACQKLLATSEFTDFYNAHPDPEQLVFGLFKNSLYDFIDMGAAMWGINVNTGEQSKACGVDAVTEEVFCSLVVGIDEYDIYSDKYDIWPNPSTGEINIQVPADSKMCCVNVYNILGNIVDVISLNGKVTTTNLNNLQTGTYYIGIPGENLKRIILIK